MPHPTESNKNVGNIWSQYTDLTSAEITHPAAKVAVSLGKILSYFTFIIPLGVFIAHKLNGRVSKASQEATLPKEVVEKISTANNPQHSSPTLSGRLTPPPSESLSKIDDALSNPLPNPVLEKQMQSVEGPKKQKNGVDDVQASQKETVITSDMTLHALNETKLLLKTLGNYEEGGADFSSLDSIFQDHHWDYLLKQIKNPEAERTQRRAKTDSEKRKRYTYDFTNKVMKEKVRENFYKGTRKTPTSLMPPNGKTKQFGHSLGLLFDSDLCQIKDPYVFKTDAHSLSSWWRKEYNPSDYGGEEALHEHVLPLDATFHRRKLEIHGNTTFKDLQDSLKSKDSSSPPVEYNEVIASVTRESLRGIFLTESFSTNEIEMIEDKLSAISKKMYISRMLNIDLPIFIKTENGLQEFTKEEQQAIISKALNTPHILDELSSRQASKLIQKKFTPQYPYDKSWKYEKPDPALVHTNLMKKLNLMHQALEG